MGSPFDKFTDRARRAVSFSKDEAERLGHDSIGSEHILLGILREGACVAAVALEAMGVKLAAARDLLAMKSSPSSDTQSAGDLPLTEVSKRILENAIDEANKRSQDYVGTEHLLLGLVREENCLACTMLLEMKVKPADVKKRINDYLQGTSDDAPKPVAHPDNKNVAADQSEKTPALNAFCRDVTQMAKDGKLDPMIGRDKEISRIIHILARRQKNNPVLLGEAGVGKTAIVEGLAQMIVSGNVPECMQGKRIVELDMGLLIAGTKFRGQFEERMKAVVSELIANREHILYIDEIHTMVGAGNAEGSVDASNMLKPALARGELQCIGATTLSEYRKYIERDTALERRFQTVIVAEPTAEETVNILNGLRKKYEKFHNVVITEDAVKESVALSTRYVTARFLPDKAIDVIDEASAKIKIGKGAKTSLKGIDELLTKVVRVKEKAVETGRYEVAAEYRDREIRIVEGMRAIKDAVKAAAHAPIGTVCEETVREVVSGMTGVPLKTMSDGEIQRLTEMEAEMQKRIVGQNDAISKICEAVRRSRAGLKDETRPIGSFMFLGPTGVGKTLVARVLGQYLFGTDDSIIKIDMSEYMERHSVSRLIGAPPGYIGYDEAGQLTEKVRRRPYAVVLFDEIEKAHPDVFNILLQVLEDGKLTDGQGRVIDFRNTIIIMTSNVGADAAKTSAVGFSRHGDEGNFDAVKRKLTEAVGETFRPEFLNRLDDMIFFRELGRIDIDSIADMEFAIMAKRAMKRHITLRLAPEAKSILMEKGFDAKYGARPMRRAVEKYIETALSTEIIKGMVKDGDTVDILPNEAKDKFLFVVEAKGPEKKTKKRAPVSVEAS